MEVFPEDGGYLDRLGYFAETVVRAKFVRTCQRPAGNMLGSEVSTASAVPLTYRGAWDVEVRATRPAQSPIFGLWQPAHLCRRNPLSHRRPGRRPGHLLRFKIRQRGSGTDGEQTDRS